MKIEPAEMTFTFGVPVDPTSTTNATIDLSQVASLLNRRFYRQGLNWAVSGFKVKSAQEGSIDVSKLPNTWVMSNAWEKSMRTWQAMNNKALEETESVRPRFLDFKIYADHTHALAGFGANLLPVDAQGNMAKLGEWEPSKIVIPDTTTPGTVDTRELIATGASFQGAGATGFNSVSCIEGYAASRGLPYQTDPNTPDDAASASGIAPQNWMAALFNEGVTQDAEVIADLIEENNRAPYPYENDGVNTDTQYPGGANNLPGLMPHDFQNFTGTTISKITYLKGGNFPCGLVRLACTNTTDQSDVFIVQVDLVPGTHRGYMAESMLEM